MADPSACWDWYFRPARNAFSETKRNHMGQGHGGGGGGGRGEYGGGGKTVTFSFFKNAVTIAEV